MSHNNNQLFEKINKLDQVEAIESLLIILKESDNLESKVRATEYLIQFDDDDNSRFQDVKNVFMSDMHPQLRLKLIKLLTKCYKEEGISFLKEQYKSCNDGAVRKSLVEMVGKYDLNESIPFLIETLNDPFVEAKKSSIIYLGKASEKEVLVPLIELLHFRNAEIYDELINSIVKLGKKGNLHVLNDYIDTKDPNIKREIPLILGKIGNKESEEILINFLKDESPLIRKNSVKALEKIIELKKVKHILEALNDENAEVRKEAIRVLGNLRSKRAISPLLEILKDNDIKIRNLTKITLYKIFNKTKTHEVLYDVLKGRNLNARKEAIKLLGMLKDLNAINLLIKTFDSTVASIRGAAYRAILKILNGEIDDKIIEGLSEKSYRIRMYCTKILGEIGDPTTIHQVYKLIADDNGSVRKAVIDALINFKQENVVNLAKDSLKSSNWKVRRAAVKLLLRTGNKEAINSLISCLNDEDVYIKSWAAMALGKLKDIDLIDPFILLLKENDDKIRLSAAKALGEIGNKDAIKSLIEALGDDNWNVRKEIEKALNRIDPEWMTYL